jgi:4-oxalocrotonate tautomerase
MAVRSHSFYDPRRTRSSDAASDRSLVGTRRIMTLIEVHLIEDVFDSARKKQIIEKLTDAMVSIEGKNMRSVTWVKISEVASGEWGKRRRVWSWSTRKAGTMISRRRWQCHPG